MHEPIADYLQQLHQDDSEAAEHWLMEAEPTIVATLMAAYATDTNLTFQVKLLDIIGYHRLPDTLPFFADVLQADDPELWKAALDSIVTLNHPHGLAILQAERARLLQSGEQATVRRQWIDEAIAQLSASEQRK